MTAALSVSAVPCIGLIVPPGAGLVPDDAALLYGNRIRFVARGLGIGSISPSGFEPVMHRILDLGRMLRDEGAQAISLVNTLVSLAVDARTRRPRLGAGFGGLSGPAIKPIALRLVYEAARAVTIPMDSSTNRFMRSGLAVIPSTQNSRRVRAALIRIVWPCCT